MSERIYACLLRLYPPAFRRRYEEETVQLLQDRLRDEPGCYRRLRLGFDLITDTKRSLPQAYRNSYAEGTAVHWAAHPHDSGPMFQSLHNEPIRRGTFVVAVALALTALIAFGYVMELPIPSPRVETHGNRSPIESVLERLNRQAPSGSTENIASGASHAGTTAVGRPENRATSTRNSTLPPASTVASKAAGQALEPAKPIPNASAFDPDTWGSAATPLSATAARHQATQRQAGPASSVATAVMSSHPQMLAAVSGGLTGRWTGHPVAYGDAEFPGGLLLVQHETVLSGFGVLNSSERNPMIHGSVSGNSVKLELSDGRKSFLYDLRLEGKELRGTLIIRSGNETRRATVRFQKRR